MSENEEYMKTNKDRLSNITRYPSMLSIINEKVFLVNKIVIHTYQFLKLYFTHLYKEQKDFPEIDRTFIRYIFKVLTTKTNNRGAKSKNKNLLNELEDFYETTYKHTLPLNQNGEIETLFSTKLVSILQYEEIDILTNIKNNISEHLIDHFNHYINIIFEVKKKLADKTITKDDSKQILIDIKNIKKDILERSPTFYSRQEFHSWILEAREVFFPQKVIGTITKNNINYHVKSDPLKYLYSMFYLNDKLEQLNIQLKEKGELEHRLFNVLPLRNNIVPGYITFTSAGLIDAFMNVDSSKYVKSYNNNLSAIWNHYFHLDKKVFKKKGYGFHHFLKTDGISCSIIFVKVDKDGNPVPEPKKIPSGGNGESKYIEKTTPKEREQLKDLKIVAIDPNYSDLVYCGSRTSTTATISGIIDKKKDLTTFRYTQNQRRLECKFKTYNKRRDKLSQETSFIFDNGVSKSVKELETILSFHNSKTVNFEKFYYFCVEKNKLNFIVQQHYQSEVFRNLKFSSFINKQRSEAKFINNFSKKFGDFKTALPVMGDFDKGGYNMKYKEPVICKRFRKIFKKYHYKFYLINEFRTSKLCNGCGCELEKFHWKSHPNKKRNEKRLEEGEEVEMVLCHGLLRCQTVKHGCQTIHNRDKNAVKNMLNIIENVFEHGKRPDIFTRAF